MENQIRKPAGFWIRLGANILDGIIIGIPIAILTMILTGSAEADWMTNLLSIIYAIVVPVIWNGYVIGKRICGIRIVKVNGDPVSIGTMLLRVLVAGLVYAITLGIGLIVSAFMVGLRDDKRGLHDFIAGTYVTKLKPGE